MAAGLGTLEWMKEIGGAALGAFGDPLPPTTIRLVFARRQYYWEQWAARRSIIIRVNAVLSWTARLRQALELCQPSTGGFLSCTTRHFAPTRGSCSRNRHLIVRELLGGLYFSQPFSIEGNAGNARR